MNTRFTSLSLSCLAVALVLPVSFRAQTAAPATAQTAAPRQSGTVKAVTPNDFVLTTAAGGDLAVNLPASARILLVDPVTRDLKSAVPGTVADIAGGDKVIVSGTRGDTGQTLTATRILLLKSGAIAAMHAGEQAAWARSVGGIVRSADPTAGTLTVANGTRTYTVGTSPTTVVRRYAGGSVRFEDAVKSTVAAIQAGDQIQARGQRSPDGSTVTADEIVTGSFSNFSGVLTAVDAAGGTVTLKDLATKRLVTVAITGQTNLRALPAGYGQGMAPGGSGASSQGGGGSAGQPASAGAGPGAKPGPASGAGQGTSGAAGGTGGPGGTPAGAGARRPDLSRIINRLPTETVADLKQGSAVMIVASNNPDTGRPTAITLLSGVEQILAASPNGATALSPWSLGGGQGEGGGEGGGPGL